MSIKRFKMADASSVTAGGRSVFNMPIGYTYHQLQLIMGGTTFDHTKINAIRIRMDGEIVQELGSGTDLQVKNLFNRRKSAADKVLIIDNERFGVHMPAARLRTVIGTGWQYDNKNATKQVGELKTLQIEVDIDASAVAPTLELWAQTSASQPLGVVRRIIKNVYTIPAGSFQITDLPRGGNKFAALDALYIKTANITEVNITKNNVKEQELGKVGNEHDQNDGVRTPQAGWFIWDSAQQGFGDQELPLTNAQDFRVEVLASAGETIEVFAYYSGVK